MRRSAILALVLFAACSPKGALSVSMVQSEMKRCPTAAELDGLQGRLKWNYTPGLEQLSFLDACSGDASVVAYVDAWYDAIIDEQGRVGGGYRKDKFNLDHICPARTLFRLYDLTGREKYRSAMDSIYSQIQEQPYTEAGPFWHKKIYPSQVWLDGFYMAEPFYAMYTARFIDDKEQADRNFSRIAAQFRAAYEKTYDASTGLCRHAWDESRSMFWADPVSGQSKHAWGRAMGWYVMALVDVLDYFPQQHPDREKLTGILARILETLPAFADPESGMWYQVLDCPGREGNYLEATCSAMFTYGYLKAARMGLADERYGRGLYEKLVKTFIREDSDGTISLTRCCAVAGLGGKDNRSGDYDYYINEKIIENDPKGVGPFIWASILYENN